MRRVEAALYVVRVAASGWVERALPRLGEAEREEILRLGRPGDRARTLAGRLLTRWALARHARLDGHELEFERDAFGRPRLARPRLALDFNVAHSGGLVVCGVVGSGRIGVDVEEVRPIDVALAGSVFAAEELRYVTDAAPATALRRFYDVWTLKEAYLKAVGTGFRGNARGSSVVEYECGAPRLSLPRSASAWSFGGAFVDGHATAWCVDAASLSAPLVEVELGEL